MVEQQRPSKDWTISIFDGEGTNFARVPNPQETVGKRASPSLYAEMFRQSRSHPADDIARGRAADYELCPLLAHRLDGCRRRRRKLAGRAALAQPRDNKRDGRRSADGRPRLCGADGDPDRPRRDAPQSPDRGAQPPRQEYARGPAVDRHPDVPQREPGGAREVRGTARRAGGGAQFAEPGKVAGRGVAGSDCAGAAALSAQHSGADADVRTAGSAVAAARRGAVDDRARDRNQCRQIRRAVERHRDRRGGLGDPRRKRRAQAAADLDRGRRPARHGAGAARLRLAADRAQRARPARRRSDRRLPAARRRLHGKLRARQGE